MPHRRSLLRQEVAPVVVVFLQAQVSLQQALQDIVTIGRVRRRPPDGIGGRQGNGLFESEFEDCSADGFDQYAHSRRGHGQQPLDLPALHHVQSARARALGERIGNAQFRRPVQDDDVGPVPTDLRASVLQ
jgi:hypothetical protein